MSGLKFYNCANGIFYVLFGLYGVFLPMGMADIMGWTPDVLGQHQLRAMSMSMAVIGALSLRHARRADDQSGLTLVIICVTLSFMVGRVLGLVFDGVGPSQTYVEIGIEIVWSAIGYGLYHTSKRNLAL